MSPANILNDADFAAAFRKVKAANHERRIGATGPSEFHAETPADPDAIDVTPDTLADRATVANIRDHLRKRDRNAPNRRIGTDPETAA